jgi:hypothetical protein
MYNGFTTTQPKQSPANGSPMAFCPDCGSLVAAGAKFCSSCGHTVTLVAPTPPQAITNTLVAEPPLAGPPPLTTETTGRRFPIKKLAVGAAILTVAGCAGTFGVLRMTDHSAETARASLHATKAQVGSVVVGISGAERLSDLREAGVGAERQAESVQGELARLDGISGKDAGRRARRVVNAERELLTGMAELKGLDPEHIASWPTMRARISSRVAQVQTAEAAAGSLATLAPSISRLNASLASADAVVEHADRKLHAWRRDYRRAKRSQRAKLARVNGYATSVSTQLAVYNGLRDALDNWISDFGESTLPFGQAGSYLVEAADKRKAVRDALANQTPPAALMAAHTSLIAVLSDAIVAMGDAGDAAQTCTADPYCLGDDFRDTSDWQAFHDASSRITSQFGAAFTRWQQGLDRARSSIRHQRMPRPPAV